MRDQSRFSLKGLTVMADTIQFSCPNCKNVHVAPMEDAGQQGQCPDCGTALTIPFVVPPPLVQTHLASNSEPQSFLAHLKQFVTRFVRLPLFRHPAFWLVGVCIGTPVFLCTGCLGMCRYVARDNFEHTQQEQAVRTQRAVGLISQAKTAHDENRADEAIQLLKDARLDAGYDSVERTESNQLLRRYQTERVTTLIESAKKSYQTGDKPAAISTLAQATSYAYDDALNQSEAKELLKQYSPPPPVAPAPESPTPAKSGDITQQNYDRIKIGWTEAQVHGLLGTPDSESESDMQVFGNSKIWSYRHGSFWDGLNTITVEFNNGRVTLKNRTKL